MGEIDSNFISMGIVYKNVVENMVLFKINYF